MIRGASRPPDPENKSDQYRATMMMATTMKAAASESARSNAFDLGVAVVSGGGMTLRRRCEFAVEPTAHSGFHRVARYDHRVNATALLALECAVVGADWP
jgi:hypothetical protein